MGKYVCNISDICMAEFCPHMKPHTHSNQCDWHCKELQLCIPIETPETTDIPETTNTPDTPNDIINHPQHYISNGMEVIDVIEAFGLNYHTGNAIKYILRAGKKTEDVTEDIQKAIWYLKRSIEK